MFENRKRRRSVYHQLWQLVVCRYYFDIAKLQLDKYKQKYKNKTYARQLNYNLLRNNVTFAKGPRIAKQSKMHHSESKKTLF